MSAESWWAAERRRAGAVGAAGAVNGPVLMEVGDTVTGPGEGTGPGAGAQVTTATVPAWQKRQRWLPVTRLWALVKMASLAYTTWWALGYVHAHMGTEVCAFGGVCLFAGVGARWRKRFFGPGQLMEPELYEDIGRWLYRIGTVLVLAGGALVVVQTARH